MPKTVYLWDIDGTLLLSGGAGKQAVVNTFRELLNVDDAWARLHPDGKTDDAIFEEIHQELFQKPLPRDLRDRIFERYHHHLEQELPRAAGFEIMPYALEVLTRLAKDENASIGLATGNYERAAYLKLKRAGMDHFFSYGGFGTDAIDRQALTQKALERAIDHVGGKPTNVVLIGDTVHDVRCGLGIGAIVVGVCTGTTTADQLKAAGAQHVLSDLTGFFDLKF